jgi:uncharacterized RmlC-like cupin family protein
MSELKAVNLDSITEGILWQADDTLAFVARGREHRSEFHADPVDEVMYMIRGDMNLHYRTPEGHEKVAVIREGEIIHCPAGIPHSPRFSPDAFVLVLERRRRTTRPIPSRASTKNSTARRRTAPAPPAATSPRVLKEPELRIGVLASHEGTTLQAIIDACAAGTIAGEVVAVISNNGDGD